MQIVVLTLINEWNGTMMKTETRIPQGYPPRMVIATMIVMAIAMTRTRTMVSLLRPLVKTVLAKKKHWHPVSL